ncbi:hypothetical protein FRB99_000869 [Tulasnella sp. 403]|nr:hypothetical protein FRB99_000869 [Tulasnella sp. 403]
MAPLSKAVETTFRRTLDDGTLVYGIELDPDWTYQTVVFGGYALSCLLNASMQSQAGSSTPDPYYITATFLRPMVVASAEVHVKLLRRTSKLVNLKVNMYQKDELMIAAYAIFGDFDKQEGTSLPSKYDTLCPLKLHPSRAQLDARPPWQNFRKHFVGSLDRHFLRSNADIGEKGRTTLGPEWGAWVELIDPLGHIRPDMIGFWFDLMFPVDKSLSAIPQRSSPTWFATLAMSLEFKVKFPFSRTDSSGRPLVAPMILGHVDRARQLKGGMHSDTIELWTAPCKLGEKIEVGKRWREEMVCVAIGRMMGMALPAQWGRRDTAKREPKAKL